MNKTYYECMQKIWNEKIYAKDIKWKEYKRKYECNITWKIKENEL
jgi:hypothetical protein